MHLLNFYTILRFVLILGIIIILQLIKNIYLIYYRLHFYLYLNAMKVNQILNYLIIFIGFYYRLLNIILVYLIICINKLNIKLPISYHRNIEELIINKLLLNQLLHLMILLIMLKILINNQLITLIIIYCLFF